LAVLPFANLTGDSAQEYLADGLTEELTSRLSRLRPARLGVIARTSAMQYKRSNKRIDEIGRDLGISYALESSLRRSDNRLRVTVQLIRVKDQGHLWADDYDYTRQDVFEIEDSVATAVAREIQIRLTPVDRARLGHVPSTNPAAVDAVMRGRDLVYQEMGKQGWDAARHYFQTAIVLDSAYAPAWAWLGQSSRFGADRGYMPADSGLRAARAEVDRAIALDSNLSEGWRQRGHLQRLVDWDWSAANQSYKWALKLDSGSSQALMDMSYIASTLGRLDESLPLAERAAALNPVDQHTLGLLAVQYYYSGHIDSAVQTIEKIPPYLRSSIWNLYLARFYLLQGRLADAEATVTQVPDPEWRLHAEAFVSARRNPRESPDSALTAYIAKHHATNAYQIAQVYAFRGETDSACTWLDRAYAQRDQGLTEVKADPLLANLRSDPRYRALLTKMRLPL
jgi:TolB-like protein